VTGPDLAVFVDTLRGFKRPAMAFIPITMKVHYAR